jgi:hypothetical protein
MALAAVANAVPPTATAIVALPANFKRSINLLHSVPFAQTCTPLSRCESAECVSTLAVFYELAHHTIHQSRMRAHGIVTAVCDTHNDGVRRIVVETVELTGQ